MKQHKNILRRKELARCRFRVIVGSILMCLGIMMIVTGASVGELPSDPWPIFGIVFQAVWILVGIFTAGLGYRFANFADYETLL